MVTQELLIHPSAHIHPSAQVHESVKIGPYSIVGPHCVLNAGVELGPHVVIEKNTRIGSNTKVGTHATLGGDPQDLKYQGETSWLEIGSSCTIREFVTMHRATGEEQVTRVGSNCYVMAYAHVAHNCQLGDHIIIANGVQMGGFVEVGDSVVFGGLSAIHQYCRIGTMAMLGGNSTARVDVPPFCTVDGRPTTVRSLNVIGMRRNNLSADERQVLRQAFKLIFYTELPMAERLETAKTLYGHNKYVEELVLFMETTKRGVCIAKRSNTRNDVDEDPNHDKPRFSKKSPKEDLASSSC